MARKPEPELTDAKWAALEPLLPPQRPPTGRPNNDHRQVVEAMVWLARTGAPWRDLPAHYGSWKTVASRFYRWRRDGIFSDCWARSTAAPMPAASWTGCATTSTAAWSAPPARRRRPPHRRR
jgi:transposase